MAKERFSWKEQAKKFSRDWVRRRNPTTGEWEWVKKIKPQQTPRSFDQSAAHYGNGGTQASHVAEELDKKED